MRLALGDEEKEKRKEQRENTRARVWSTSFLTRFGSHPPVLKDSGGTPQGSETR